MEQAFARLLSFGQRAKQDIKEATSNISARAALHLEYH